MKSHFLAAAIVMISVSAQAEPGAALIPIDHTVVRFFSRDGDGIDHPNYITEHIVAFEARLVELEQESFGRPFDASTFHLPVPQRAAIRSSIDTHIAETLVVALPMESPPSSAVISQRVAWMRKSLAESVGSEAALQQAAAAEGIGPDDIDALVYRETLAAIYIDHHSTPIFDIPIDQLRAAFASYSDRFKKTDFTAARDTFSRWLARQRLRAAEMAFFQQARSRVHVSIITDR